MSTLNTVPTQNLLTKNPKSHISWQELDPAIRLLLEIGGTGTGDVVGTPPSTDKAIARYNGATGVLIQNSLATISDAGVINIPAGQTYNINGVPLTTGLSPTGSDVGATGAAQEFTLGIDATSGAFKGSVTNSLIRSGDNTAQTESTLNKDGTVKAVSNGNSTYSQMNPDGSLLAVEQVGGVFSRIETRHIKVSLTDAQILTGQTVPIVAIPAPGAGKLIRVVVATMDFIFGSAPFVGATILNLQASGLEQIQFNGISNLDPFTTSAAIANAQGNSAEDIPMSIVFDADSVSGDSTINLYITYEIITL